MAALESVLVGLIVAWLRDVQRLAPDVGYGSA